MTEPTPTVAQRCTTTLLHDILDYLCLQDVVRAMAVNKLWREHAINHPTYYGNLYLVQPNDLEFFLLRLSRSAGRPISVNVDLGEQTPLSLMQEIGNHLSHITTLTLSISTQHSVPAVLKYISRPAPIMRNLMLLLGVDGERLTTPPPPATLPKSLLAGAGPALDSASVSGFDLSSGIPQCFSRVRVLSYYSGWHDSELILPNPFEQCPRLEKLCLGNAVSLHPNTCCNPHSWERMKEVSFVGSRIANRWPAFGLPLHGVDRITVRSGDATSTLALADTLSGPLHVTFPPPRHHRFIEIPDFVPLVTYKAILHSMSHAGDRSRMLEGTLSEHESISAFSEPALADRVVLLELALEAWNDFVGLSTFGPFNALDKLVLDVKDGVEFRCNTALPKLSCPKLQDLVVHGAQPALTVDMAAVAKFAIVSLSKAQFPIRLEVCGLRITGAWNDFPEAFRACIHRAT